MKNEIAIPILNNEYKVIVCWGDSEHIRKVLKAWKYNKENTTSSFVNDSLKNRRGVCFYNPECHPVIALPKFPKTSEEIGTLAHEAVHAVNNILEKIEEGSEVGEVFAHSVGAVVMITLSSIKKKQIKRSH